VSHLIILFLFPLLSGYVVNRSAHEIKYITAHESGYSAIMLALLSGFVLYIYSIFYLMFMGWVLSLNPESIIATTIEDMSKWVSNPLIETLEHISALEDDKHPILNPSAVALSFFFSFIVFFASKLGFERNDSYDKKYNEKAHLYYGIPNSFAAYMSELEQKENRTSLKPGEKIWLKVGRRKMKIEHELLSSIYDEGFVINLEEIISATIWSEDIYEFVAEKVRSVTSKPTQAKKKTKKAEKKK